MSEEIKVSKAMAKLFYEQCCGTFSGHMANVPNNPTLFGITGAHSSKMDNCYSMSKTEFGNFCRQLSEHLSAMPEF